MINLNIRRPPGLKTHREIFTRYLKEAPRWLDRYTGKQKIYPWQDWLSNEEIIRCEITGWYGRLGEDVLFQYDFDWPVLNHPKAMLVQLAEVLGYEVEWRHEPTVGEVVRLSRGGDVLYDFCDTFIPKEERVTKYLEKDLN